MARRSTAAAYTLVDLSELPEEIRKDIIDDAQAGGGEYGVRVVEESVNGPARFPIFGVYGHEKNKWDEAKKELKITSSEVDDAEVIPAGVDVTDPRKEAALRSAAIQQASAQAERMRVAEDEEVEAIVSGTTHASNIVDDTLDPGASNVNGDDENDEAPKLRRSRAPR